MKTIACQIPWSYLSNELSCSKKYQGVTKIHPYQGRHINCFSNKLFNEKITLELLVTLLKIQFLIDLAYSLIFN